jgi:CubicO group peptidase (beta-lactamase class C family)
VELLKDRRAQVFAKDKNGRIPADLAYDSGHTKISELLMPLHYAGKKGDLEQIRFLLENDPETINSRDRMGRTPLHRAMRYNQEEAARLLIERGADREIKDAYGHPPEYHSEEMRAGRTGIDSLETSIEEEVDRAAYRMLSKYSHINLGLVYRGEIVFTKSFGEGSLSSAKVWGSVSKPVTATIVMHLVSRGKIESIDEPIWKYSPRYRDSVPASFADAPLTIRHLLTHKSGIPHNNEPTWKDGKLNLKFRPGTRDLYSTPGYGVLGHVIEAVTGKSFSDAAKHYIGSPVGATTFWAENHFRAPGARVHSTVEDMAKFSIGIMNHLYVPEELFYKEMIRYQNGPSGIGWSLTNIDSPDLVISHGGSNGRPQAYLLIKPKKKLSVSILATAKSTHIFELDDLANSLLSILEDEVQTATGESARPSHF